MSNFVSFCKYYPLFFFHDFSFISNVLIKIHEYSYTIISISDHHEKVLFLKINLITDCVL